MKEIAPNTYLIDAQYFQEGFNAVYLIVSQGKAMLVDCGTAHSVPHIGKKLLGTFILRCKMCVFLKNILEVI